MKKFHSLVHSQRILKNLAIFCPQIVQAIKMKLVTKMQFNHTNFTAKFQLIIDYLLGSKITDWIFQSDILKVKNWKSKKFFVMKIQTFWHEKKVFTFLYVLEILLVMKFRQTQTNHAWKYVYTYIFSRFRHLNTKKQKIVNTLLWCRELFLIYLVQYNSPNISYFSR